MERPLQKAYRPATLTCSPNWKPLEPFPRTGLKPDATHYCELIFDVNSAYFDNHGGYEFAKRFYADAYKAAVQIVGW